jgi:hypothetical protein
MNESKNTSDAEKYQFIRNVIQMNRFRILKEDFLDFFFMYRYVIQHCFICRPSDSTVSGGCWSRTQDCSESHR